MSWKLKLHSHAKFNGLVFMLQWKNRSFFLRCTLYMYGLTCRWTTFYCYYSCAVWTTNFLYSNTWTLLLYFCWANSNVFNLLYATDVVKVFFKKRKQAHYGRNSFLTRVLLRTELEMQNIIILIGRAKHMYKSSVLFPLKFRVGSSDDFCTYLCVQVFLIVLTLPLLPAKFAL